MAKGTVKNGNDGGMNGMIIISSTEGYDGTDTSAGELISFTEAVNFPVGTAVTFDITTPASDSRDTPSTPTASNIQQDSDVTGTVISANQSGNMTINANQTVTVNNNARLSGNVSLNGGSLYVTGGGSVNGNLNINGAGSVIVCDEGADVSGSNFIVGGAGANSVLKIVNSTVNGRFSSSGIAKIKLIGNTHNGNVSSSGDGIAMIQNNTISGNLSVTGAVSCQTSGNTVSGSINTPGCS